MAEPTLSTKETVHRRQSAFMNKMRRDFREAINNVVQYTSDVKRKHAKLEKQVYDKMDAAENLLKDVPDVGEEEEEESTIETYTAEPKLPDVNNFVPKIENAVFCGHLVTDLDSIAGAIGAAALYKGTPASASEINSETVYALKRFGCPTPRRIEEILEERPDARICLVDHQQTNQMNPAIPAKNVVGIIDHYALQNKTLVTEQPIYCDLRPWGSASSIIGHSFPIQKRRPGKKVAGILLCAILSDTLNLQSPTTTDWDRIMVAALADLADVEDIDLLAVEQFRAKSQELAHLSAYSLVHGDQKTFSFDQASGFKGEIGFAVIETTDDTCILARVEELVPEMVAAKAENNLDLLFLAVVNIVGLRSQLVLCGAEETSLAEMAFGGEMTDDGNLMNLGSRVSRKQEFIPGLAGAIEGGWNLSEEAEDEFLSLANESKQGNFGRLEVNPSDPYNQVHRVDSAILKRRPSAFLMQK